MGSKTHLSGFLIIKIRKGGGLKRRGMKRQLIGESFPNLLAEGRFPSGLGAEDTLPDPQDGVWGQGATRAEPRVAD